MVDIKTKIPRQEELILATVKGENVTSLPEDLYVPPNALEVLLDTFAGPLDFLLYLIKKQNINITDINVELITEQYTSYINLMEAFQIELAGDYLVMAAYLAELKSIMLLPRHEEELIEEPVEAKELSKQAIAGIIAVISLFAITILATKINEENSSPEEE